MPVTIQQAMRAYFHAHGTVRPREEGRVSEEDAEGKGNVANAWR